MALAVVALLPVDVSHLPRQNELPRALPDWHLTTCPGCSCRAWLSPTQERVSGALRLCYYCIVGLISSGEYRIGAAVDLAELQVHA